MDGLQDWIILTFLGFGVTFQGAKSEKLQGFFTGVMEEILRLGIPPAW